VLNRLLSFPYPRLGGGIFICFLFVFGYHFLGFSWIELDWTWWILDGTLFWNKWGVRSV